MSFTDRKGAHDAMAVALADHESMHTLAHAVVDDLCDVIDSIAKQAAAQSLEHAKQLQRMRASSTSPPPSNETEAEKLQARQVKALEQIAYALTNISTQGVP